MKTYYELGRSIPACAGEPARCERRHQRLGVYPRVCGGTWTTRRRINWGRGLSPRVRGNLTVVRQSTDATRSIPACAGEPTCQGLGGRLRRVYPRVCGGTLHRLGQIASGWGLSPRVRGNHYSRF